MLKWILWTSYPVSQRDEMYIQKNNVPEYGCQLAYFTMGAQYFRSQYMIFLTINI